MAWKTSSASPTPANTATDGRRLSWDVIRVIALGAVLLFHATYWGPMVAPGIAKAPFEMPHQFGASTLLVVSGFFAAHTVRKYSGSRWWLRRMARLLPAYAVAVLIVFSAAHLFAPPEYYHPDAVDLIGNLLLLHMWIPGVNWVDGSFWTLPVQVGVFTAIALLAYVRGVRGNRVAWVLWAVVAVPLVIRWTAMQHDPDEWLLILVDGSGLSRAHLFVAGVGIWLWAQERIGVTHLVALLGAVLLAQDLHPPVEDSVVGLGIMLVLICLAARGRDWDFPGLRQLARPIRWLAGISYGVYLLHQNIGYLIARKFTDLGLSPWLSLAAFFGAAVLLGWGLTVWVERPAFRRLSPRTKARPRPVSDKAAAPLVTPGSDTVRAINTRPPGRASQTGPGKSTRGVTHRLRFGSASRRGPGDADPSRRGESLLSTDRQ
jgi:peptidoglycan/LPS O-acetylase OafA/YrhL